MGLIMSYLSGSTKCSEPDPATGLTPREKQLVANTWAQVKKNMIGVGVQLFLIFFKDYPQYQSYFPFRDLPYDDLHTSPKLKSHAANVMYAFSAIIDNLDNGDVLIELLSKNGSSHSSRNIPPEAYDDLQTAIVKTLQQSLGSKLSKEACDAWNNTLTVAMSVIKKSLVNE